MRLERAEEPVGEHEDALPDGDAGLAGEAPVDLSHDAGELLVAHEHRADGALVVVERIVEAAHVAAGDAEDHVDAGFLEHADDAFRCSRSAANSLLVIEPAPLYSLMRGKSGSGVTRATAAAPSCLRYPSPSPNGVSYSLSPSNLFRSGFPARKSPGHTGFSPFSMRR